MRILGAATALVLALAGAGASRAEGFNNFVAGLNGIVTAPADPVMMALEPPAAFDDLPERWYWTAYPMGAITGILFMTYRAAMGVWDVVLTPFWVFPTLSPEANWDLAPGWEIEWE